ncbi:MAG: GTPase Era [Clostridia bacterium]|jgi:GTP-binding protein Era|nr:GTPase Era [Clostridiaceae bacterium]
MSFKSGFVTIVGRPNTGKSTLINQIIGEKLVIISDKPQTTRNVIRIILTDENSQLIFLDTPGIHKPRTKLGEYMVDIAKDTLKGVDAVVFLTDDFRGEIGPGDRHIIEQLKAVKTPVILAINKIDTVPKENILKVIDVYRKEMEFSEVVPISALTGEGVSRLVSLLRGLMPEGPMYYPQDYVTDQPERQIAAEYIREKILNLIRDEIPHGTGVEIITFKEREEKDLIDIQADIYCEKESHKKIIIGKSGSMLKKIGTEARVDLEALLGCKVNLQLFVKVRENWRNSITVMDALGYRKK